MSIIAIEYVIRKSVLSRRPENSVTFSIIAVVLFCSLQSYMVIVGSKVEDGYFLIAHINASVTGVCFQQIVHFLVFWIKTVLSLHSE